MGMRQTPFDGFTLRINISLLAIAIAFAVVFILSNRGTFGIICLITGWALALVAAGPSLFRYVREIMRKGKGEDIDPNTIVPGWKQFYQTMGIQKDIKIKVFPNVLNAYANRSTIEIGQPVLDSLDIVSIKAVLAHELTHIKGNHGFKQKWLPLGIWSVLFALGMLSRVSYSLDLLGLYLFTFSVLLISASLTGIAIRFISWPLEYKADLGAVRYVGRDAVISFLTTMSTLRKMDTMRDFFGHPSVNKRIANLGWSQKTRFRRWYLEL